MKRFTSLAKFNFLAVGVVILLLFVPLYPKFPLFNISKTYVAVRIEDLIVAVVLMVWLITEVIGNWRSLKSRWGKLMMFYWLVGALSLVSALLITKNVIPHLAIFHWLRRVEYMAVFLVSWSSIRSLINLKVYVVTLFLAALVVWVVGVGQKFWGWPVVSTMNSEFAKGFLIRLDEWARVSSTFAGHYDLAAFLVVVLTMTVTSFFIFKGKLVRLILAVSWLLFLYLLILTASRVSFAAYLLGAGLLLLILKRWWWLPPFFLISLIGMVLSSDLGQRYALTLKMDLSPISGRISGLVLLPKKVVVPDLTLTPTPTPVSVTSGVAGGRGSGKQKWRSALISALTPTPTPTIDDSWRPTTEAAVAYSNEIRFKVEWPRAVRALVKNPLLGTGYSSVGLATDNDYLRALAETGFLGFGVFGWVVVEILRRSWVFWRKGELRWLRVWTLGLTMATIGLLANAFFIDVFEASKVAFTFWLLAGATMGTVDEVEESA